MQVKAYINVVESAAASISKMATSNIDNINIMKNVY